MNKTNKNDSTELSLVWEDIHWKETNQHVSKLQRYIFTASKEGDLKRVRKWQHLLLNSLSAKLIAVRTVTQDNLGKKTAGVDGIKSLTPTARIELARKLKVTGKCQPVRRVWIPKPGSMEKRPLGIPTIYDRALQALVKMALEPEWEGRFEPNSYGFRPGRSTRDAIKQIKICLDKKSKYVLDADIAKCFDRIDHEALLKKLGIQGKLRNQVRAWLKSGTLTSGIFEETQRGTPQGGLISPLLANVAFHGLETVIKEEMRKYSTMRWKGGGFMKPSERERSLNIIRYADDFVVMHEDKTVLLVVKSTIEFWLKEMGLEFKDSKTRIAHTLDPTLSEDQKAGFNFLGFHIQHYPASRRSYKNLGVSLGYRTVIVPSNESIKRHLVNISKLIKTKGNTQSELIRELNLVIRGWSRYFSTSSAHEGYQIFRKLDYLTYIKIRRWSTRITGSVKSSLLRFWHPIGTRKWVFSTNKQGSPLILANHIDVPVSIDKYVKVKGDASPFDGNIIYWTKRLQRFSGLPSRKAKLLRSQNGKCAFCNSLFQEGELLHEHHVVPLSLGGKDTFQNLQLVHSFCHHRIHGLHAMGSTPFLSENF
uniref:Putative reverse transcriptase and intron maturase n=1 Tax=Pedinomonas tuberculata TaxID=160064 RepID=A0A097KLA2_9CHLO|nr:putative reverse transcriptase and intron maturase [Pedinomonas tuberculata]AIT93952.1 putative reverse transcriptase and intron maturase [Pedinomonas tuberculata]